MLAERHRRPPGGRTCGACSSTAATSVAASATVSSPSLIERLRAEGHDTLLVSWHPGPGGPEPFYLARGFVPTGQIVDGEIEARLTL